MQEYQANLEAYKLLSKLYTDSWGSPQQVPMQIALMLLHARDHMGKRVKEYFSEDVEISVRNMESSLSALDGAVNAERWTPEEHRHQTHLAVYSPSISA